MHVGTRFLFHIAKQTSNAFCACASACVSTPAVALVIVTAAEVLYLLLTLLLLLLLRVLFLLWDLHNTRMTCMLMHAPTPPQQAAPPHVAAQRTHTHMHWPAADPPLAQAQPDPAPYPMAYPHAATHT